MVLLVNLLATAGIAGVLPACLKRLDDPCVQALARVWLLAAVPGAIAVWMPRGPDAVAMTGLYAAATVVLAACAPLRVARTNTRIKARAEARAPRELLVTAALVLPAAAAAAQLADRAARELPLTAGLLTLAACAVAAAAARPRTPARIPTRNAGAGPGYGTLTPGASRSI